MTRAANNDFLQGFRYHVVAATAGDASIDPLQQGVDRDDHQGGGQAGFQSVTAPELTVEAVEYREGTFKWTEKYPGPPTVSDCTLIRGVTKSDTAFFDWVKGSIEGQEYRAEVTIYHYQRTEMSKANGGVDSTGDDFRTIVCHNCVPTRAKPGGDLDSMSGEVSMAEVDFAMESFDIKGAKVPAIAAIAVQPAVTL